MIGTIPETAFSDEAPSSAEREAFHTLRAALTYFNVDRPRRTVVVASPGKGDGKTTVAIQLAVACARAGDDVILIDADLRRQQIADRLDLPGNSGLASALAGRATLDEVLVPFELTTPGAGRLRVIAGRERPPNPAQLLGSQRMADLLAWLPDQVDMAIIDATPALMVATRSHCSEGLAAPCSSRAWIAPTRPRSSGSLGPSPCRGHCTRLCRYQRRHTRSGREVRLCAARARCIERPARSERCARPE